MIEPCIKTITDCRILPHGSDLDLDVGSAKLNNVEAGDFCGQACNNNTTQATVSGVIS